MARVMSPRAEQIVVIAILGSAGVLNLLFWILIGYGVWRLT